MKKIKVLFVIDSLNCGGKERQLVELVQWLLQREVQVEIVTFSKNIGYHEFLELNIPLHFFSKDKLSVKPIFSIIRLVKKVKPTIIHSWEGSVTFYSVFASVLFRIPLLNGLIRDASSPEKYSIHWFRNLFTFVFSKFIVANSKAGLEAYRLKVSHKNRFIHNGFSLTRLEVKGTKISKIELSVSTKYVVGMVANFESRKDYETYLKAAQIILDFRDDVTFLCLGDGPNLKICESFVKKENKEFIKFLGKRANVESIVSDFDIGVLICNTNGHAEGISNSIMEYMALGKPVIATDSGGNKELIENGKTGFLIPAFDTESLVQKIIYLLDNENVISEFGKNGKNKIINDFSIEKMGKKYLEIYQSK